MRGWLKGKRGGVLAFAAVAALVTGGLGWATREVLRLEADQARVEAEARLYADLRLALWRLDSKILPELAKEAARPYNHYSAVYAPSTTVCLPAPAGDASEGRVPAAGKELLLDTSPLLSAGEVPSWMLLHFQTDLQEHRWSSPQVLSTFLSARLAKAGKAEPAGVTPQRRQLLEELAERIRPETLADCLAMETARREEQVINPRDLREQSEQQQTADNRQRPAGQQAADLQNAVGNEALRQQAGNRAFQNFTRDGGEYGARMARTQEISKSGGKTVYEQNDAALNTLDNGAGWFRFTLNGQKNSGEPVRVRLGELRPLWVPVENGQPVLAAARLVEVGKRQICQGIVLDWNELRRLLAAEVEDLFPEADFRPVTGSEPANPERTMTALPVEIVPAAVPTAAVVGWTPLRIGVALAWAAAAVALLAVALGGWSLIDLSERRIRFVSAVTHELRTPLTTLRLYLDMLTGGMVTDEARKGEYLTTLHSETERLNRLVANVLDFARLEGGRTQLQTSRVAPVDAVAQAQTDWEARCREVEKKLVVEDSLPAGTTVMTDGTLLQRILGNLIDNACKYARRAVDNRIHLRVGAGVGGSVVFEVADHGPGVPRAERRSIFRAFRQGRDADPTAGGVGLGLALAKRWAGLLGGQLSYRDEPGGGACFSLELPASVVRTDKLDKPA